MRNTLNLTPILATLAIFTACSDAPVKPPLFVLVALDSSGSARPDLAGYVSTISLVAQHLNPDRDRLTVFRFDHRTSEIFDGLRPKLLEAFELKLADDLAPPSSTKGTLPAKALSALADAAARLDPGTAKIVIMLTDGGNDDQRASTRADHHAAARRLADDPSIKKVILAGVRPGLRESVRDRLSPLQTKLVLTEFDSVAKEVR